MKGKILICDDMPETGVAYKNNLEQNDAFKEYFEEPILAGKEELESAINSLDARLRNASKHDISDYPSDDSAKTIDEASILIIDYALFNLDPSVTGERLAYLARCYSKCGIIIALNQYPPYVEEHFDLSLRGHLESYADLNLPSNSLGNPGLWTERWNAFRPWSWPLLPKAIEKYQNRVNELASLLDERILEYLGFTGPKVLTLPRSIIEFLSREKPDEATFRNFVNSGESGNGLRGREEVAINDEAIARIAAARIGNWLEYNVLPGQDILVDAPHLISRFPSLLGEHETNDKTFNSLTSFSDQSEPGFNPTIESFRFTRTNWISRPVWFWNDLRDCEEIEEVKNPFTKKHFDYVFCEDTSKFKPKENVRNFVAALDSPYARRYVEKLEQIQYTPAVRFSL